MALEKAGVVLTAENYDAHIRQITTLNKLYKDTFSSANFKAYNDALKRLNDTAKSLPKIPVPKIPPPDDAKKLEEALAHLGKTGKYAIQQISDEALKLQDALRTVSKSGKFSIGKVEPIKSNILGDLTKNLDEAISKGGGFKQMFQNVEGFLGGQFVATLTRVGGVMAAVFSIGYIKNFVEGLLQSTTAMNTQFENFEVQFQTLLGSTDAAKARLAELAEFANKTPYELPGIVQANRLLQTFGGNVLATGDNLTRIGDAAAAVNAPFESVAFWIGRMYSAMKNGQPFGESSARLQELGLLSGDVRNKLEEMQKTGVDGAKIWEYFSGVLDTKFAGAMDRLSKTFGGMQSTIDDFHNALIRIGGTEYFEVLKQQQQDYYKAISDPKVAKPLEELAKSFGHIAAEVQKATMGPLIEGLKGIDPANIKALADAVFNFGTALGKFTGDSEGVATGINGIIKAATDLTNLLTAIITPISTVNGWIVKFSQGFWDTVPAINALFNPLSQINSLVKALTGVDVGGWLGSWASGSSAADKAAKSAYESMRAMQAAGDAARDTAKTEEDAAKAAEELAIATRYAAYQEEQLAKAADKAKEALEDQISVLEATKDALKRAEDIQQNFLDEQAQAKEDYDKGMAEAEANYLKERERTIADFNRKLVQFDQDNARKRAEMIDEFNFNQANREKEFALQRAQSEQNYDLKVKQDKRKFYDDQKKALRDFQLSIVQEQRRFQITDRRLRAEGDVLALMEAREDFAIQQQENGENFQNQQTVAKDAFAEQQRAAEENFKLQEQQARDSFRLQTEIQREEFQRRLEEFDANIAIQRERMLEAHALELEDLAAKFEEEKVKLKEQYDERMALAQEQRDKQMQALGDSLKEEGKITEEGMQEIAAKISEVFGDEGAGDNLIKGWSERSQNEINNMVDNINVQIARLQEQMEAANQEAATVVNRAESGQGRDRGGGIRPERIGMRHGGSGIVTGPATFHVEPGVKEHYAFTPVVPAGAKPKIGSSMEFVRSRVGATLDVTGNVGVDVKGFPSTGVSADVEQQIANTLMEEIKTSIQLLSRQTG